MPRISLDLDDDLYSRAAQRAAGEGVGVEAWIVAALNGYLVQIPLSPGAPLSATPDNVEPVLTGTREHRDDATAILRFYHGPDAMEAKIKQRMARLHPALLADAERNPALLEILLFPYQPGEAGSEQPHPVATEIADLAGSWDGLHYLLSPLRRQGARWAEAGDDPFGLALYGLPFEGAMPDLGQGRPGYLPEDAVLALAAALASLGEHDLQAVYDPSAMDSQAVYPLAWTRDNKEGLAYLLYYFEVLRDFYLRAAQAGEAVVLCYW